MAQLVAVDLLAGLVAVVLAYWTRFGPLDQPQRPAMIAAAALLPLAWLAATSVTRAYDLRFVGFGTTEFGRLARAFTYLTAATAFVSYAAQLDLARGFVVVALPLTLALSCLGRYIARLRLRRLRRSGRSMSAVLAVGRADSVLALVTSMRRDLAAGLHVVAACLPEHEAADPAVRVRLDDVGVRVAGDLRAVRRAVDVFGVHSVAVIAGDVGTHAVRTISWELESTEADLVVSSGLSEVVGQRVHVQSVAGLPLLRVDAPKFRGFRRVLKGAFDRSAAGLALLMLSPVLLTVGLLVRFTSRGPAFYRQERIGRNGKPFRMVKFRSMRVGADAEVAALAEHNESDGVLFKMREDPRVTPVGKWLRRFSLDELPQLFNILTGSMSLVGPRPPLPAEVAMYERDVRRRLLVKPGLTGLWQVSGRSDLSWEDAVRLDLHYVENWTLALDMLLIWKTARAVVKASGAY